MRIAQTSILVSCMSKITVTTFSAIRLFTMSMQIGQLIRVHEQLKYEIAHTLQNAGLDVTILHEKANQGRTILEKFADHAQDAGYAVVLLTADDVGSAGSVSTHEFLQPRARQNVVFELGFFFGLLGRGRVCAVYETGVELPSDLHGLARVEHDSAGSWKHDVAREIHAAGIPVDFSKL